MTASYPVPFTAKVQDVERLYGGDKYLQAVLWPAVPKAILYASGALQL